MVNCENCNGEGTVYEDTSNACATLRNECCGGCGHDVECDECEGTGEQLSCCGDSLDDDIMICPTCKEHN